MTKTFYSVTFAVWGSDFCRAAWFDDKAAADDFAAHDFRDAPVAHTYRKADSIRAAENRVVGGSYIRIYNSEKQSGGINLWIRNC